MADKPTEKTADAPAAEAPAAPPAGGGGIKSFLPLIIALVLAPILSWATVQFLFMPKLKAEIAAISAGGESGDGAAQEAPPPPPPAKSKGDAKADAATGGTYKFENMIVNLSGTMGTRYLKTSFTISGPNPALAASFEAKLPQLVDVTLGTLASLSLADLEEAGSRNVIRARLISAYNEALGKRLVEQIFFTDFVVQ